MPMRARMSVPQATKYAIIGAGIHGLSTAFHLAQMLKATGKGSGADIVIVDKTAVAAGASGIACGVVRNNYFQPAMRELMAHSVEVWESDPKAYCLSSGRLHADQPRMHARRRRLDLRAAAGDRLRVGVHRRRRGLCQLHEGPVRRLAGARHHLGAAREARRLRQQPASMHGLAAKAEAEGVRILPGVEVQSFEFGSQLRRGDRARHQSRPDRLRDGGGRRRPMGQQDLEHARAAEAITVKANGKVAHDVPMWKFWCLEEGTLGVDP